MEELGIWAGFALTLMVYSYIIRDNFLYRIAVYIFVGLTAGYTSVVTIESVLVPWFDVTVNTGEAAKIGLGLTPVLLTLLLFMKNSRRFGYIGNFGLAIVVAAGAGVALVGALTGTLIPLAQHTVDASNGELADGLVILVGVTSSLIYFQYLARRTRDNQVMRFRSLQLFSAVGQGFIVVTLGALYAGAILTSLAIFSERIGFMLGQF